MPAAAFDKTEVRVTKHGNSFPCGGHGKAPAVVTLALIATKAAIAGEFDLNPHSICSKALDRDLAAMVQIDIG